jgi:uncharacterized protein
VTLLLGVLVASLIGSVHCAAMCGSFVCLYAGVGPRRQGGGGSAAHAAYHAGRLVSYVALGLAAGALGARANAVGALAGIERGAAIVAGTLMVAWAASVIARSLGVRIVGVGTPDWAKRRFGAALIALRDQPAAIRAGATGLLTTLLPCGWLYTFVATAGGTGNAIAGAVVMLVFWAGTVPMLLGVGLGVQRIGRPIARHLPVASAVLVLVLGALSIAGRLRPVGMLENAHHAHATHDGR